MEALCGLETAPTGARAVALFRSATVRGSDSAHTGTARKDGTTPATQVGVCGRRRVVLQTLCAKHASDGREPRAKASHSLSGVWAV